MVRSSVSPPFETIADVLHRLGGIAPKRVRMQPPPGEATERDLLRVMKKTDRLFELVDATLVEKVMGYGEGGLAADIIHLLRTYLDQNDLGDVLGADTTMRLMPGLVRLPDVSFVRWEKYPNRERPVEPIPDVVPDLAVEVLSAGNTPAEMERKRKEYFFSGVRLVWLVDPLRRTIEVFNSPDQHFTLSEDQTLDGGEVLPGFSVPVRAVFARTTKLPSGRRTKKGSRRSRKPRSDEPNP